MTAESATFNSGGIITGDLLAPGTPTVQLNGSPTFGGTIAGTGVATPTGYQITLNSGARLGHLRTRTDALALPSAVTAAAPIGTRNVSLNSAGQSAGDFTTLRNLTLNSNVGQVPVPAGVYGDFTVNSGSGITLGTAGATTPAVYAFQHLTLNSSSALTVVGPVTITVANAVTFNSSAGTSAHPEWLTLLISSGGLTLNSSVLCYGSVVAPSGTVTINSSSQLVGSLTCDRLTINSGGLLRLINQLPAVALTMPSNNALFTAPASSIPLLATASDSDGVVAKVEFFNGATLLGQATTPPYQFAWANVAAGTYSLTTKATDNSGGTTTSSPITIIVNAAPTVSLNAPVNGSLFLAPAAITLQAIASDADGTIAKVDFFNGSLNLGTVTTAPYQLSWASIGSGTYVLTAVATDNRGAATASAPVSIVVDAPPTVSLTSPANGAVFIAPTNISLSAVAGDLDGTVAKVEFFAGSTKLGQATTAPYQFLWTGVTPGNYTVTAKATDNLGVVATSAPIGLVLDALPTVTLTAPANGGAFVSPASIPLTAVATDSDGTIAKVEFYRGAVLIGTLTTPSVAGTSNYTFTQSSVPPGTYVYHVRTYDNVGGFTDSAPVTVTVLAGVPYLADFELSEGYSLGLLAGQLGWSGQGSALVTGSDFFSGTQSVSVQPATPPAQITQTFAPVAGEKIIFVDFYTKPVADANLNAASVFDVGGARFAFLLNSAGQGVLQAFNGDGLGGGQWDPSPFVAPLALNNQSQNKIRLTARLDFTNKTWDLYANGTMVAADLGFRDSLSTYLGLFSLQGHTVGATFLDYFFVAADNPLFADINNNGIDDAWELAHGLSLAVNNRKSSPSGNGVSVLQAYLQGTDPNDFYNGQLPNLSILGGDNQSAPAGQFNAQPLSVLVLNATGTSPLNNAPVTFSVIQGGGLIALGNTSSDLLTSLLAVRTGPDGTAKFYYRQPVTPTVTASQIRSTAGRSQVIFQSSSQAGTDPGATVMPDAWQMKYFGRTGVDPNDDPDGDGISNLQEYRNGTDPNDYYNGKPPVFRSLLSADGALGPDGLFSILITSIDGTPLANAPVTLTTSMDGSPIALSPTDKVESSSVTVRAGGDGVANVYLRARHP